MKFTLSWLRNHLDTDANLEQVVDTMVKVGLEVEEIYNPADRLAAITVGHVLSAEKHPDADKLKVCLVATKDGEQQIVCGAPNAREGIKVAYAPVGAYISGIDVTLSKAKIRGVESFGMMCSVRELELGEEHDGIMELDHGAQIGTPLADILGIDDPVIDFEVTPNRPDTNGITGVARDLAAAGLGQLIEAETPSIEEKMPCPVQIITDDSTACPAFAGRVIRGVKNGPSPQWLQELLRAIGLRPINMLVDVTNFLSYDRARPLHVYDLAKLSGTVRARMGKAGETLDALDGKSYAVDETMCVIADDSRVLGLGGVMGGTYSGCTEETTDVLIESALFDPLLIAKTGRKTTITSDARYRFERGVDPASTLPGLDIATHLILAACGGEASEVCLAGTIPTPEKIVDFPPTEVLRLTGMDIPDGEKETILTALGFTVQRGGVWQVSVPSHRPDIDGKADLVEEIARIYGLNNLPTDPLPMPAGSIRPAPSPFLQRLRNGRQTLCALGYHEAVTWAFCDEKAALLFGGNPALKLSNPISADLNMMRPSALPNLLAALGRNQARGAEHVRMFEVGGRYETDAVDGQKTVISVIAFAPAPETWQGTEQNPDVFSAKSIALSALEAMGAPISNLATFTDAPDFYHPGRKGRLGLGPKTTLASFGEIHPSVLKQMDVAGPVVAAEIFVDAIPTGKTKLGRTKVPLKISSLMPLSRSFAFVVTDDTPAEKLLKAIKGAEKSLITDVRLFDVYTGEGIPDGHKSLAVEVTLQPIEKTLTDEQIEAVSGRIIAQAQKATGASIRSA